MSTSEYWIPYLKHLTYTETAPEQREHQDPVQWAPRAMGLSWAGLKKSKLTQSYVEIEGTCLEWGEWLYEREDLCSCATGSPEYTKLLVVFYYGS